VIFEEIKFCSKDEVVVSVSQGPPYQYEVYLTIAGNTVVFHNPKDFIMVIDFLKSIAKYKIINPDIEK
jgi:hypothetical protein